MNWYVKARYRGDSFNFHSNCAIKKHLVLSIKKKDTFWPIFEGDDGLVVLQVYKQVPFFLLLLIL